MLFEEGDKVIVLSGRGESVYAGGWVDSMDKLVGKELTLDIKVTEHGWRIKETSEYIFDERFMHKIIEDDFDINQEDFECRLNEFLS